ncbi:hypothetical protein ACHAXT_004977 [Thalassiosira profunda]
MVHPADDGDGHSVLSQPLLVDAPDENDSQPPLPNIPQHELSTAIRRNFLKMSALFALNHGCSVAVLGLASARLGQIGVWQSGVLFGSYTASALFGASYFVTRLGARNGLVMGMEMSAGYVASFFLASLAAEMNERWAWLQGFVAIAGALVGGVGSSILWVSQGTYFSTASQLFATMKGASLGDITGRFSGNFAFIFLVFEVIMRVMSTLLIETAGVSWKIIFGLYSVLSILPVVRQVLSDPNSTYVGLYTAVTSTVAALASLLFGTLESSHHGIQCGKELVLTLGAASYLVVGMQFLIFPHGSDWSKLSLLWVYILLGVGRATYEGTLRAIFADFFPENKEGGFGNIILFSGTASTVGYVLSVTNVLRCEEGGTYCTVYSDGSTHNVLIMELLVIVAAVVAIPSFWRAVRMFRGEQENTHEQ